LTNEDNVGNHIIFKGHTREENGVKILDGGKRALSWSADCNIILWELENKDNLTNHTTFLGHTKQVNGLELLDGGKRALSWSSDKNIMLWDLENKNNSTNHIVIPGELVDHMFVDNKLIILTPSSVRIFDVRTKALEAITYSDVASLERIDCLRLADGSVVVCAVGSNCLVSLLIKS